MGNVIDIPLGINESERLVRVMIDAVSAHYRTQGKTDAKGRADVPPRALLRALAAMAGQLLHSAPVDMREAAFTLLIDDVKEHAGL